MYKLSTYSSLTLIILKDLRKNKTQLEMSKLLNKNYNIYHRWESGEQRLRLSSFISLLEVLDFDIQNIIHKAFNIKCSSSDSIVHKLLSKHPVLNHKIILKYLKISETSWWRITNNKRDIYLDEFLLLSNYQTQRTNIFLQELGLNIKSNLIKMLDSTIEKFFLAYINYPELSVVGSAIYLKSVRSMQGREQKIAEISLRSKQPKALVKCTINSLLRNNILFWDQSDNLDFKYFENSFSGTREIEVFNSLKNYLIRHLNTKISQNLDVSEKLHFRIAPVSSEASELISEEIKKCSQRISTIIANDSPIDRTKIIGYLSTQIDF